MARQRRTCSSCGAVNPLTDACQCKPRIEPVHSDVVVTGKSTLIKYPDDDPHGRRIAWVKERPDRAMWAKILPRILEPLAGALRPSSAPVAGPADRMVFIPVGDPHLDLRTRHPLKSWDIDIAIETHAATLHELLDRAPTAGRCVLAMMGDNLHANDRTAKTPRGGHSLDVSCSLLEASLKGCQMLVEVVDRARAQFPRTDVVILGGNHDMDSVTGLVTGMAMAYRDEPRVRVDTREGAFRSYRFGRCLLGLTHGHTVKSLKALSGIMPGRWGELWGETDHHHWYTGHRHNDAAVTLSDGAIAESIEILGPLDRYASDGGYSERRSARLDVWDARRGLTDRTFHRLAPAVGDEVELGDVSGW